MKRLHLMEIHEQLWCPAEIRDGATDCLRAIADVLQQYRAVVPLLQRALDAAGSAQIIDLCSGGAGPWLRMGPQLQRRMQRRVPVVLTDLYPSSQIATRDCAGSDLSGEPLAQQIIFAPFPVDATRVSPALPGFRTLFTAFHHFKPATAQAILQSAVDQGQGIGIFEQTRRSPLALLVMLVLPPLAWLFAPFLRPFRWSRLLWTYVIPAIPLVLLLDGLVSCLRTYEPEELRTMVEQLHGPAYIWEIGRLCSPLSPIGVTYLVGWPAHTSHTPHA
jgi:hypothetical protein